MAEAPRPGRGTLWLWALLALPLIALLDYHAAIIGYPLGNLGSDACEAAFAHALALGQDPTSAAWLPTHGSAFGFVHATVAAWIGGPGGADNVILHRCLAALGLFLALLVLGARAALTRSPRWAIAAVLLSAYAAWLFGMTPNARPDGLAVFFFVASFCLGTWPGLSLGPAFLAGALAVLGFFTKPYALLGLPLAVLAALLDRRWRQGAAMATGAAVAGLLGALWIRAHFQNYLLITLTMQAENLAFDGHHLLDQAQKAFIQHGSLFVSALVGLALGWRAKPRGATVAGVVGVGVAALMCGHDGVYLSYFEQLALPVIGLGSLILLPEQGRWRTWVLAGLLLNAFSATYFLYRYQPQRRPLVGAMARDLERAVSAVAPGKALLAPELQPLARRYDQAMPDNSTLRHFLALKGKAGCSDCEARARELVLACEALRGSIQAKVNAGDYDLILQREGSPFLVGADLRHYRQGAPFDYWTPGDPFPVKLVAYLK